MHQNDKKNDDNLKKIMCFNILNNNNCNYGNKCMYAHSLNEQKIEPLRHKVYTIIKSTENLNNIDLVSDVKLYDTLLQLTKICTLCSKGLCPGGYNCRNGAINIKYKICYDDLVYGNCKKNNCQSIHLTNKGLIPYNKQKNKNSKNTISKIDDNLQNKYNVPILDDISDQDIDCNKKQKTYKFNKKYFDDSKYIKNDKIKSDLNTVKGILLTEKFILAHFGKTINSESSLSDSEKDEDINKMINYFNNNEDDSDEESIFLV